MKIMGLQKSTLLDYPGKVACTVFTGGCNFFCPFCHNAELISPRKEEPGLLEKDLLAFLRKRRGILDGVCISGGEPLLHTGLSGLIREMKELGYLVKLDTNRKLSGKAQKAGRRGPFGLCGHGHKKFQKEICCHGGSGSISDRTGGGERSDSSWKEMYRLSFVPRW